MLGGDIKSIIPNLYPQHIYIYIYTQEARNKKQEKKKIIDQIGTLSRSEKRPRRIIIFARRKGKSWFVPPHPLPRLYIYIYIYIFDS